MWTVRIVGPVVLLACAGGEEPSDTGAADTGSADTGSEDTDTDTDTSDGLPDGPTGDGVIIAELSYDGTVETVR